ncbi:unnamed protein product, partial [marine sediment metagenome]
GSCVGAWVAMGACYPLAGVGDGVGDAWTAASWARTSRWARRSQRR